MAIPVITWLTWALWVSQEAVGYIVGVDIGATDLSFEIHTIGNRTLAAARASVGIVKVAMDPPGDRINPCDALFESK
jgi:hypothetical protein